MDLSPHAFTVKELELLGPSFVDELVLEHLTGNGVAVSATVALLGAVCLQGDLVLIAQALDPKAARSEATILTELCCYSFENGAA